MSEPSTSHPFRVLKLPDSATPEEIELAYRRLVRRYPPELNPRRFAEIHRAYKTLTMLDRTMEEAIEHPIETIDQLYPPPAVHLRPPGEEPPARPTAEDLEPLIQDLRRQVLLRVLQGKG